MSNDSTRTLKFKIVKVAWQRDQNNQRHAWIKAVAQEKTAHGGVATYEVAWYSHPSEGWQLVNCWIQKLGMAVRGHRDLVFLDYAFADNLEKVEALFFVHVGVAIYDEKNGLHRQLDRIEAAMYEEGLRTMRQRVDENRLKLTVKFQRTEEP